MTSLLTNTAAMVALKVLNDVNGGLNEANNRVSTGLKIREAQDSAAYWAIATTTKSDNSALGTVKDALAIGKATLDVTYSGLDSVRESLQKMKDLMLAARQAGTDRANVQTQITGLITDMQNKSGASVMNEQNWLSVDTTDANYNATKSVVASFERSAAGIAISTIDLDITDVILIDAGAQLGILDEVETLGTATNSVLDIDISALTDSAADIQELEDMIGIVDARLIAVITAQNSVGVNQARVTSQEKFVSAVMDANNRAVGSLVDANMEEESTRLRALQTQQQLAVQSLSIANSAAQNVLSLFR